MKKASRNILLTVLMAHALSAFAQGNVSLEAETGRITPPFAVTNGCLVQALATNLVESGCAVYDLTLSQPGDYVIVAIVSSPGYASSLAVGIDSEPTTPNMIWDIPVSQEFTNRIVTWRGDGAATNAVPQRKVFNLTSGSHQVIFRVGAGAGAQLDRFSLARIPSAPGNLRVVTSP